MSRQRPPPSSLTRDCEQSPRKLVDLSFTPNTLTSMTIPGTDHTILAAGGQEAEIHLSCYSASKSSRHSRSQLQWQYDDRINGSINNSLLLTSLSMCHSNESSAEPRIAVSNNDGTVRFFDIPIRSETFTSLPESGCVRLAVPINHCKSLAPPVVSQANLIQPLFHRMAAHYSQLEIHPRSSCID